MSIFLICHLTTVNEIFNNNNLSVFDVEELSTHGGSLRVFVQKKESGKNSNNFKCF